MTPVRRAVPDPRSLLDPVRDYLAEPRCAVLATVGDGGPHQVVVHYLLEEDALVVNGRAGRRWLRDLERDPRVSVAVHDADDHQHWVGLQGRAEPLRSGRAGVEDAMTLARRYGEDPAGYEGQERVSMRIVPRRVYERR